MKKCKSGYYYCNTDKKCKPIPRGYRVGYGGYLRKEKDDDDSKSKSNGNGNGNGNGSNGNGNGGNGSGGNGGGGNGGGMGEEVTHEAVAAIPAIAGASKVIPAVVAGVGALGTIMQASRRNLPKRGKFGTDLRGRPRISSKKDESKTADIAKEKGLDVTDARQRRKAYSLANKRYKPNKPNTKINPKTGEPVKPRYPNQDVKLEAKMTEKEKKKKEEIVMSMKKKKKDFEDRYGDEAKSVMYATATKLAMGEGKDPKLTKIVKQLRNSVKKHQQQSDYIEKINEESNPRIPRKKGQPANSKKHSDLYTDENPKGTIHGLGFKDVATAKASVSKIRGSSRSHAHKIQAAVAMEQRAREMGKSAEAAIYRKFINSMKKKTEKMNEGSLHKWFKGSKSKDGKGGWVNVVTGGTCASDEPGEGTPKCVSSSKRASMTKAERLSAARRKKKADPNQQSKSGAAKPTYVSTDSPRKKKKMKEEIELTEVKDKKGKGSGSKDACYHKVKSRYSVWPSAYASGALVKCRKVGAANWGNSKKEEFDPSDINEALPVPELVIKPKKIKKPAGMASLKKNGATNITASYDVSSLSFQQFMEKCWKGYEKKGMKTMFGKRYPNCVKKEETVIEHHQKDKNGNTIPHEDTTPSSVEEGAAWTKKSGKNPSGGLNEKGRKSYERENPGSDLKRPSKKVGNKRRASFCARMRGMKKKLTSAKTARDPDSRINKSLRAWNC